MTYGSDLIASERLRQISDEGYTPEHDRRHEASLVRAARVYASDALRLIHSGNKGYSQIGVPSEWPWAGEYYKPTHDSIQDLVKAGALIAAAIDSIDRERREKAS